MEYRALSTSDAGWYRCSDSLAALLREEHVFLQRLHTGALVDGYHDIYKRDVN